VRQSIREQVVRSRAQLPGRLEDQSVRQCQLNRDLSEVPAAQQLWHVSKTHLLELFKEGVSRRDVVQSATLALRTRHALAVPVKAMPIFEGKAAIVPRPEPPWLVKSEEQPVMMVPVAEVTMVEMRHMTEPEDEVAIAELEHETALAEIDTRGL
jgi:hypothetical protein